MVWYRRHITVGTRAHGLSGRFESRAILAQGESSLFATLCENGVMTRVGSQTFHAWVRITSAFLVHRDASKLQVGIKRGLQTGSTVCKVRRGEWHFEESPEDLDGHTALENLIWKNEPRGSSERGLAAHCCGKSCALQRWPLDLVLKQRSRNLLL